MRVGVLALLVVLAAGCDGGSDRCFGQRSAQVCRDLCAGGNLHACDVVAELDSAEACRGGNADACGWLCARGEGSHWCARNRDLEAERSNPSSPTQHPAAVPDRLVVPRPVASDETAWQPACRDESVATVRILRGPLVECPGGAPKFIHMTVGEHRIVVVARPNLEGALVIYKVVLDGQELAARRVTRDSRIRGPRFWTKVPANALSSLDDSNAQKLLEAVLVTEGLGAYALNRDSLTGRWPGRVLRRGRTGLDADLDRTLHVLVEAVDRRGRCRLEQHEVTLSAEGEVRLAPPKPLAAQACAP